MIKFFRNIRKKLVSDSKFSRYFLYAIGEIVLVVIGILFALQINTWNENAKNRKTEISYLNRISKELDNDLMSFTETIELAESRNNRVNFLQRVILEPEIVQESPDYFVESIIFAGYTYTPSISNHSFEELKSSGRLELINNSDLRVSMAKYYDHVFNSSQWEFIREDVQLKYYDFSSGILNQEQRFQVISHSDSINISLDELDSIVQRYLSKKTLHQLLPLVFEVKYDYIIQFKSFISLAESLKLEIQNELKKYNNEEINDKSIMSLIIWPDYNYGAFAGIAKTP